MPSANGDVVAKSLHRVYGTRSAAALLERSAELIVRGWCQADGPGAGLAPRLRAVGIEVQTASRDQLDQMADGMRHQGVVLEVNPPAEYNEADLKDLVAEVEQDLFILVLDQVQDPRNLGACLRAADGAGVSAVVVPKDRAARLTPVVAKTASGAAYTVPLVRVTNLARSLRWLGQQGVHRVGLADEVGLTLYKANLSLPLAVVIGSEGEGLRRLTRECCDELVGIPMHGAVESLNVAVATGVTLFEVQRSHAEGKK